MTHDGASVLTNHPVVSHEEWLAARTAFLAREKEFTRLRDQVSEERRRLPWEAVTKAYVFEGPSGKRTLAELFEGRSQLVVYHAMFDPRTASPSTSWTKDAACHACSAYGRGIDLRNATYNDPDLAPKGRDEGGRGLDWVRRHDEYDR